MTLLEDILNEYPGIEKEGRSRQVPLLMEIKARSLTKVAEVIISRFDNAEDIKQIYWEMVEYIIERYSLGQEEAVIETEKILGYASAASPENRQAWFDTLPDISHPIFGRSAIPYEGKTITELYLIVKNPNLLERVETALAEMHTSLLMGDISYDISSKDPLTFRIHFTGHLGECETHVAYLVGLVDGIRVKVSGNDIDKFEYSLRWNFKEQKSSDDVQSYWERKLEYVRLGDRWFEKGLKSDPERKDAWISRVVDGEYPGKCSDGSLAPSGLHLTFNHDHEDLGTGQGAISGFSFLGKQRDEFLEACQVKNPNDLVGKKIGIYEIGMRTVGVEVYKEEK